MGAGPFRFCHAPAAEAGGELCGHFRPKASITTRVALPAFGAYRGGLDVRDPVILSLFPRGARVFLLGRERLSLFSFAVGGRRRMRTGGSGAIST